MTGGRSGGVTLWVGGGQRRRRVQGNDRRAVGGVTLPRPPACLTFSHEAMDLLWEVGRRRDLPAFSVQGMEKFD